MKKVLFVFAFFLLSLPFLLRSFFYYHYVIPIEHLNSYEIPCTSIEIEGNHYLVEIDLGSKTALSLHPDILKQLKKESMGTSKRMDFLGNHYETKAFLVPQVSIGSMILKKAKAKEESSLFALQTTLVNSSQEPAYAGRIGRDLFEGKNVCMDFSNRFFAVTNDFDFLNQRGYHFSKCIAVPFECTSDGIIFECETDLGKLHLILDTGSTLSVVRKEKSSSQDIPCEIPLILSSKFLISGMNFGPKKLGLIKFSDAYQGIDGLLGMDFLKEHFIYLDFKKKIAYLTDTKTS